ncbi:MAG: radical SAM protein [Candidatus Helarchaeota archaeon]
MMYNPLEISKKIKQLVVRNDYSKRYYRFRGAKFYGGISTADVVGCNMHCVFCWVHPRVRYQCQNVGAFYSPEEVGARLVQIAEKGGFSQIRISGGEPTIGMEHLLAFLDYFDPYPYTFILETNGMLLSARDYVQALQNFSHLYVRISLKAATPSMFVKVTGAEPKVFDLPLQALELLVEFKIPCHPSIIIDFCTKSELKGLIDRLNRIKRGLGAQLEYESLIFYPHVKKGLRKAGFKLDSRTIKGMPA